MSFCCCISCRPQKPLEKTYTDLSSVRGGNPTPSVYDSLTHAAIYQGGTNPDHVVVQGPETSDTKPGSTLQTPEQDDAEYERIHSVKNMKTDSNV